MSRPVPRLRRPRRDAPDPGASPTKETPMTTSPATDQADTRADEAAVRAVLADEAAVRAVLADEAAVRAVLAEEAAVRALLAEEAEAMRTRDAELAVARYATDAMIFDLAPPLG